jgi:hypothetical protein
MTKQTSRWLSKLWALAAVLGGAGAPGCADDDELAGDGPQTISSVREADRMRINSGLKVRLRMVVRDEETWELVWKDLSAPFGALPVPDVDFGKRTAIVVAMGEQSSINRRIDVDEVVVEAGAANITVRETSGASSCPGLPAFSQPTALVTVPRFLGEATFGERAIEEPCR